MSETAICPGDPVAELWDGPGWSAVSARTLNCLHRNGIGTVGYLAGHSASDLKDLRAFGDGCLAEVRRVLGDHGLALAGEPEPEGAYARGKTGQENREAS